MNTRNLLCGLCIIAMVGCNKDKPVTGIEDEEPDIAHTTQSVTVSFPDGAAINYDGFNLFSLAEAAKLDAGGKAKAAYDKGRTNIAWLFDRDDRLVMAGALQTAVQGIGRQATAQSGMGYVNKVMASPTSGLLAVKQADINIVGGGQQKSGVEVSSEALSNITLTNYYRRRAHAFFYKTKFKDLNGVQKTILSEMNETTGADKEVGVAPVEAITAWGTWSSSDGKHVEDVYGYLGTQGGARIIITLK